MRMGSIFFHVSENNQSQIQRKKGYICTLNDSTCPLTFTHPNVPPSLPAAGCLNGGGQLLPAPGGPAAMDALDAAHHAPEILLRDPSLNPAVQQFYAEAGAGPGGEAVGPLLWTSFRSRKADAAAAAALAW